MDTVRQDFTHLVEDLKELHLVFKSCDDPTWVQARRDVEALQGKIAALSDNGMFNSVKHVDKTMIVIDEAMLVKYLPSGWYTTTTGHQIAYSTRYPEAITDAPKS